MQGIYVEWRALVGPRYDHYDWSQLSYASIANLEFTSRLAVAMDANSNQIRLQNAAAYPAVGGVFVGGRSGFAFEYIQYEGKSGNVLTPLERENTLNSNHGGIHPETEFAYFWYPIESDDGTYRMSIQADDAWSVSSWTATIKGVLYPDSILRNGHLIVVQIRYPPTTTWRIELIGVIDSPNVRDDHKHHADWSINIKPVPWVYGKQPAKAVRVGNLDIAKKSEAQASAPIVLAQEERKSGDFVAAEPEVSAESVVDGDNDTLWISDRFVGNPFGGNDGYPYVTGSSYNNYDIRFDQVYINPPPEAPPRSRYIILYKASGDFSNFRLYSANGGGAVEWALGNEDLDNKVFIALVEDEEIFQQMNPSAEPAHIIENGGFFNHIRPAGGELRLRFVPSGAPSNWQARMIWGDKNGLVQHDDLEPHTWDNPTIKPPGPGETMRFLHDDSFRGRLGLPAATDSMASWWETSSRKSPGYIISTSPDQYVLVTLPPLGLVLAEDITANVPANGGYLKITDAAGNPSTAGLANSGTLQIASEWFGYSSKDEGGVWLSSSGGRGASGTTKAAHKADDPIYVVVNGKATDAHMIASIGWQRFGGTNYPMDFDVSISRLKTVRPPGGGEGWQLDWTGVAGSQSHNQPAWSHIFNPPQRVRHIMIRIEKMTVEHSRARLNEVSAILDPSVYQSSTWLGNGATAYQVMRQILLSAGMPAGAIVDGGGTVPLYDIETGEENVWTVISDLAEFTGSRLVVGRDSKVRLAADLFWTSALEVDHTWTLDNVAQVERAQRNGLGTSKVTLKWRDPGGTEKGEITYPDGVFAEPDAIGAEVELDELIYINAVAARTAARRKYLQLRYPYTDVVELAVASPSMEAFGVHELQWTFNLQRGENKRYGTCTGADHSIEKNVWYSVLYLSQIERDVEF